MNRIKNALVVIAIAALLVIIGQQFDIKPATTVMVLAVCFVLFGFFLIWVFKNEEKLKKSAETKD